MISISNYHTPYMICTISICQQRQDQKPIYVHHQTSHLNQNNYVDQEV